MAETGASNVTPSMLINHSNSTLEEILKLIDKDLESCKTMIDVGNAARVAAEYVNVVTQIQATARQGLFDGKR